MEKYCISLPQAKRLVELGFERESQWGWANDAPFGKDEWYVTNYDPVFLYPAYHVGELGEILGHRSGFILAREDGKWLPYYSKPGLPMWEELHDTEAQAKGALLIYLLENGLI